VSASPGGYRLMGIVNVTPDSFSDGGLFLDSDAAVEHGLELVRQGAHILDVGGESTRPGAEPVGAQEELRRVVPVVEGLAARARPKFIEQGRANPIEQGRDTRACETQMISIDTSKASVADAALRVGASLVNDVSALRADPEMAGVVADAGAECCLMHMLGEPRTMQRAPRYHDVVDEVRAFLEERLSYAVREGVDERRVLLDPGIGFGKTVEHNLALLGRLAELTTLGRPIVIGTSRKSFLGRISGDDLLDASEAMAVSERLPGTIATNVMALERGARVFRVHDVAPVAAALAVAAATLGGKWTATPTTS
jgi:dihydropteroate synthase